MKRISKKAVSFLLIAAILTAQMVVSAMSVTAAEITASSSQGETVYFKLPKEWTGRIDTTTGETVLPGVYVTGGTHGEHTPWVGEHMTLVEGTEDIYSYVIPEDQTDIIFNTGMQRDWQTGDIAISGGDMIYIIDSDVETKNAQGHWEPYNTDKPKVATDSGVFNFVGKKSVRLNCYNATTATYRIDNGEEIPFENGEIITIGDKTPIDTDVALTLTASNGTDTTSYTYVYHKLTSFTVYAKNSADWDHVFVHYWGGDTVSVWPGVEMSLVDGSEDVYYAELPMNTTNFKFNNGDAAYGDGSKEEQTSNLATQSIVTGISDCYIINALASGETANSGEFTSLEKALSGSVEEGKPIITVENASADLDSTFDLNITLQNVETMCGYIITVSYDPGVIEPILTELDENMTANVTSEGELRLVYSTAEDLDFTSAKTLATIPFKVVAEDAAQINVKATPVQMYSGLETKVNFPSSNIVAGKVTVGVDRTALGALLDEANALDESLYTASSYQNVVAVAANAKMVYDNPTSTQAMIDEQTTLLQTALDELVEENEDGNYYYFKNTVGWENVYAYWWGSTTECPAFPGVKISLAPGSADVYRVDLPVDATGLNFNDGSNEDGNKFQTDSITGDNLTVNGNMFVADPEITTEKNNGIRYGGTVETYTPRKIYFVNNAGWDEVYCYWWGNSSDVTACPAFPGVQAKLMEGSENIYYCTLPDDATGFNFSNGKEGTQGGEQTDSMSTFECGKLLKMDLSSKYEKNGGYRYTAEYVDLNAYINGVGKNLGDIDNDGKISVKDVTLLQKYLSDYDEAALDSEALIRADVNFSADITILDATKIQQYIAQLITEW